MNLLPNTAQAIVFTLMVPDRRLAVPLSQLHACSGASGTE